MKVSKFFAWRGRYHVVHQCGVQSHLRKRTPDSDGIPSPQVGSRALPSCYGDASYGVGTVPCTKPVAVTRPASYV